MSTTREQLGPEECIRYLFFPEPPRRESITNLQYFPPIYVAAALEGRLVKGLYDSGANINLIPRVLFESLDLPEVEDIIEYQSSNGTAQLSTSCIVTLLIGLLCHKAKFYVNEQEPNELIFGRSIISAFRLNLTHDFKVYQMTKTATTQVSEVFGKNLGIPQVGLREALSPQQKAQLDTLLVRYSKVFAQEKGEVGRITTEKCHLRLSDNMPITCRAYPVTQKDKKIMRQHIDELLNRHLIEKSTSPYAFPVVLVDKQDEGAKTRLCIDYRKLNNITNTEHYPMPRLSDIEDKLLHSKVFSTLDLSSGFHHIEVNEEDRPKTAFVIPDEHYQWTVMPFGLKNAPIIFQRVLYNILKTHRLLDFTHNYIDDIIVFSNTLQEHFKHLELIFQTMEKENIKLKHSKCHFAMTEIVYLGHKISHNKVRPLNDNVRAILEAPPPTSVKTLRGFLGKVNYYHRFIPNRASLLNPLYELLRKNATFEWTEKTHVAFEKVKQILSSEPTLRIFDPELETTLYTDASIIGLGAVLKQTQLTGEELPVGYFSRKLLSYQRNYSTTELECLAILEAIEYWHYYLCGLKFNVVTDHQPLQGVVKMKRPNTRLFNWAMRLNQYDMKIRYRPGSQNHEADFLSRHPVESLLQLSDDKDVPMPHVHLTYAQQLIPRISHDKIEAFAIKEKLNLTEMDEAQLYDLNLRIIQRPFLKERLRKCRIIDGIIHHFRKTTQTVFIPADESKQILKAIHLGKGHIGIKKLYEHYRVYFYTPNLPKLMQEVLSSCDTCLRTKDQQIKYGMLGRLTESIEPFDVVYIDTVGGFTGYGSLKKFLHIAVDGMSRFVWVTCSKTQNSLDFKRLIKTVMEVKTPNTVVTDRYPALTSRDFRKWLEERKIQIVYTPVDHSESNGMVERVNRNRKILQLETGDLVLIKKGNQFNLGKLEERFEGPFPVISQESDSIYKIARGTRKVLVHVSKIKRYNLVNEDES